MVRKDTVYAFIDSQNINMGVSAKRWNMDWGKFRLFLKNKYHVSKAYLFIGYIEENNELYERLKGYGFIVIYKKVLAITKDGNTTYKGNVDAELVLHTMVEYPNYDKAIIATGDGDFFCLIEYLEKNGKLGKIVTPHKRFSSLLKKYSKYVVNLYTVRKKLGYVNKKKERHSRGKQG